MDPILSTEDKQTTAAAGSEQKPNSNRPRRRRRSRKPRDAGTQQGSWTPVMFKVPVVEGKRRFHDFGLPDVLLHAIADLGFEYCTPIQAATIPHALQGRDLIGKAQTGTGKTAAFLIGIMTDLLDFPLENERKKGEPRALIIAPTRELALQIAADAEGLGKYTELSVVSLVGGMDYEKQRKALAACPVDILVATPGRLIDFVRSKEVDLFNVEVLVLDEADRMLSMGFIPDVRTIIRQTPRKGADRQTLLYSATFTDDVMRLAEQWTLEPVTIEIESEHKTTDNVAQKVFLVSSREKYQLLRNYLRVNGIERAIVFGNRRHETRALAERLSKDGIKAALMSGEIPQHKRLKTLEDFRSGKIEVLVATDVAGRGIHIDGVTHVINYQLPEDADDYVHRIGRTGRAGQSGTSICFACENDSFLIPDIERETGVKLECIHPDAELLKPLAEVKADDESADMSATNAPEAGDEQANKAAEESTEHTAAEAQVQADADVEPPKANTEADAEAGADETVDAVETETRDDQEEQQGRTEKSAEAETSDDRPAEAPIAQSDDAPLEPSRRSQAEVAEASTDNVESAEEAVETARADESRQDEESVRAEK
jgi:ATP-dependent RNA helicase RhlB